MRGVIIKQGLKNPLVIDGFKIVEHVFDRDPDWDMYTVEATRDQIDRLSNQLLDKWYAHFWDGREVVVVFKDHIFELNYDDKASWKPAVNYGLSVGIPIQQLDFPID